MEPAPKKTNETLEELRKLRDEIRVKVHLAGMEARERWEELEPKLEELEGQLERSGARATEATSIFFEELAAAFRRFRDRIDERTKER